MSILTVPGAVIRRTLDHIGGVPFALDEAVEAADVAQLLTLQSTRTPEGITAALAVSRDALGTSIARAGAELVRTAPTRREAIGRGLHLVRAVVDAGARSVAAKFAHGRTRPYDLGVGITSAAGRAPRGSSFPSTHAAIAHAVSGVVELRGSADHVARTRAMAQAVSDSRMYLGVHFPTDVRAGEQIGRRAAGMA